MQSLSKRCVQNLGDLTIFKSNYKGVRAVLTNIEYKELKENVKAELDTISSLANNIISELPIGSGGHLAKHEIDKSVNKINELLASKE